MTPLHCAAMDGNKEMAALLLELGANVKAKGQVNKLFAKCIYAVAY
jgi:ankyrin repeat protein